MLIVIYNNDKISDDVNGGCDDVVIISKMKMTC